MTTKRPGRLKIIRRIVDHQRGHCDAWANDVYQQHFLQEVQEFIGPTNAVLVTDAGSIKAYIQPLSATVESLSSGIDCIGRSSFTGQFGANGNAAWCRWLHCWPDDAPAVRRSSPGATSSYPEKYDDQALSHRSRERVPDRLGNCAVPREEYPMSWPEHAVCKLQSGRFLVLVLVMTRPSSRPGHCQTYAIHSSCRFGSTSYIVPVSSRSRRTSSLRRTGIPIGPAKGSVKQLIT